YATGRYLAMTGHRLPDVAGGIAGNQAVLETVIVDFFPEDARRSARFDTAAAAGRRPRRPARYDGLEPGLQIAMGRRAAGDGARTGPARRLQLHATIPRRGREREGRTRVSALSPRLRGCGGWARNGQRCAAPPGGTLRGPRTGCRG